MLGPDRIAQLKLRPERLSQPLALHVYCKLLTDSQFSLALRIALPGPNRQSTVHCGSDRLIVLVVGYHVLVVAATSDGMGTMPGD